MACLPPEIQNILRSECGQARPGAATSSSYINFQRQIITTFLDFLHLLQFCFLDGFLLAHDPRFPFLTAILQRKTDFAHF